MWALVSTASFVSLLLQGLSPLWSQNRALETYRSKGETGGHRAGQATAVPGPDTDEEAEAHGDLMASKWWCRAPDPDLNGEMGRSDERWPSVPRGSQDIVFHCERALMGVWVT